MTGLWDLGNAGEGGAIKRPMNPTKYTGGNLNITNFVLMIASSAANSPTSRQSLGPEYHHS